MTSTIEPNTAAQQRAAYERDAVRRLALAIVDCGYRVKVPNTSRQGLVAVELLGRARALLRTLLEDDAAA